jgi:hypothetical protein
VNGTSKEKSRWGLFIKLYKLCLDPKLQAKKITATTTTTLMNQKKL